MCYSSRLSQSLHFLMKNFIKKECAKNQYHVGLGQIKDGIMVKRGIVKKRKILTPQELEKDFSFLKKSGIKVATIFTLGGLNRTYMQVIEKYSQTLNQPIANI